MINDAQIRGIGSAVGEALKAQNERVTAEVALLTAEIALVVARVLQLEQALGALIAPATIAQAAATPTDAPPARH